MNVQFNIMDGLEQVRKKDFIENFIQKHVTVKRKDLEKELTAVNRDFNTILYHNRGFLIKWSNLIIAGRNFGDYITSFNMDDPASMITVGGNFQSDSDNQYYGGMTYAIHPNIYRKTTSLKLPTVKNGCIIKICFTYIQQAIIPQLVNKGLIFSALQIPHGIFANNAPNDGLWAFFRSYKCHICDDDTKLFIYLNDEVHYECQNCNKNLNHEPRGYYFDNDYENNDDDNDE